MATTEDIAAALRKRIDESWFAQIRDQNAAHRLGKYFDHATQTGMAAERLAFLGLLNSRPLRILDIGTAFGYFPAACDLAGHDAYGLDEDMPLLHDVAKAIGFRYIPQLVVRYQSLPNLGKFDLVTAYGVNFGYHDPTYWGWGEYEWLIDDLLYRLNDGGRIVFRFNRGPNTDFLCNVDHWREITGCECSLNGLKLEIWA